MFFAFSAEIILIMLETVILTVSKPDEIIEDKSDSCVDGFTEDLYMTYRAGRTDASVILIANSNELNCSLQFNTKSKNYIILVIEFPDWRPGWIVCGNKMNEINVMVSNSNPVEICSLLQKKSENIYRMVVPRRIQVQVISKGGMDTVKIIATALRDATAKKCDRTEIECKNDEETYCMSKILECDTHFNCGVKDKFDEDPLICHGYQQLGWISIIIMIATAGITFLLILAIIWNLLPKKKKSFVFHGKGIFMEGFDNTARHFVVDIETHYLDHLKSKNSHFSTISDSKDSIFEIKDSVLRSRSSAQL